MALSDYKLKSSDYEGKRIADLSDRPTDSDVEGGDGLSADMLKAYFDYIPITVLGLTKLNGLIDFLTENGGGTLGISEIAGLTESETSVTEAITALLEMVQSNYSSLAGEGRETENVKQNADDIIAVKGTGWASQTVKNNADQITAMKGAGWTSENLKTISDTLISFMAQKAVASGLASLDGEGKLLQGIDASNIISGVIPSWAIPDDAKERTISVVDEEAMLALTIDDVQDGDVVYVSESVFETAAWYKVVDATKLGSYDAFKIMTSNVTVAETAKYYDPTSSGILSIATNFSNLNTSLETAEGLIEEIQVDIQTLETSKAGKSTQITTSLLASGWSGTSAPYTYSLSVSGVTSSSNQDLLPTATITEAQLEALQGANIIGGSQSTNAVTLLAYGEKPTITLPIVVVIRGD